jgi:hypothetical protein
MTPDIPPQVFVLPLILYRRHVDLLEPSQRREAQTSAGFVRCILNVGRLPVYKLLATRQYHPIVSYEGD